MGTRFLHVGLEGIWHGEGRVTPQLQNGPIDYIGRKKPFFRLGIGWFSGAPQSSKCRTTSPRPNALVLRGGWSWPIRLPYLS